jgi:ABC-type nickel/cobalt efflux system permease component RcnA
MNETVLTTIAVTGFGVAFFHAAMPTHWLPFVLTARAQHWNSPRTLAITALAGSGHVLFTALLGLLIAWFGIVLNERIGGWFPKIAGGVLIAFGLFYLLRQIVTKGQPHTHLIGGHPHAEEQEHARAHKHGHAHEHEAKTQRRGKTSDRVAIGSLLAMLTFSPCEAFLPIYASGVRFGWSGFALLTVILSVGTVTGMVVFTSLTLAGVQRIKLAMLEKYEGGLIGLLLCLVGVLILFFEK